MLSSLIGRTVDFCIRHARAVILLAIILGVGSAGYAAQHFAISTDISKLISSDLPWRQRQLAFQQEFPDRTESKLVVVNAPTPELAREARDALINVLLPKHEVFRSVRAPDRRNARASFPTPAWRARGAARVRAPETRRARHGGGRARL